MLDLPHNSIKAIGEKGGRELDGGYKAGASLTVVATRTRAGQRWRCGHRRLGRLAVEDSDAKARGRNTEPWGRTPWFYRGDGCEKGHRPPRSPSLPRHATASRRGTRARDPYPFPPKSRRMVSLPKQIRLFSHRGDTGQKVSSPARRGPESPRVSPTVSMAISTRNRPAGN